MKNFISIAIKVLIGILVFLGIVNLFLFVVSFFREELLGNTNPLMHLGLGLLYFFLAFILSKARVEKRKV